MLWEVIVYVYESEYTNPSWSDYFYLPLYMTMTKLMSLQSMDAGVMT